MPKQDDETSAGPDKWRSAVRRSHASGPSHVTGEYVQEFALNGWMVALYLGERAGQSVVTELRVFPEDSKSSRTEVPHGSVGEWSHSREAQEAVPDGGLTTAVLRKIPLSDLVRKAREDRGFYAEVLEEWAQQEASAPRRPGRRGRDDLFYATVAEAYVRLVADGSRKPIKDMADQTGTSVGTVENRLREARKRGMLTPGMPGRPGGQLTDLAEQLVNEEGI